MFRLHLFDLVMSVFLDVWLQGMLILMGVVCLQQLHFFSIFSSCIFLTLLRLSASLPVINTLKQKMSILQILKRMFE